LEESQLSSALPSTAEIPRKEKVVLDFQSRKKFIADFDCYFEGGVRASFGVLTKFNAVKVKLWRILSSFKVAELYFEPYPLHSHCH